MAELGYMYSVFGIDNISLALLIYHSKSPKFLVSTYHAVVVLFHSQIAHRSIFIASARVILSFGRKYLFEVDIICDLASVSIYQHKSHKFDFTSAYMPPVHFSTLNPLRLVAIFANSARDKVSFSLYHSADACLFII